ncbi:hypothetical protein CDAR_623441 [Caerostris darwini]|uniref:Uncharacterized protein n=1 Tax=Caerostris darwini TaxID=1538125 RepID=A0AAV4SNN1_9ARAC|nr:hypothetical protein CDAR_623441 [Caerostris darwini]
MSKGACALLSPSPLNSLRPLPQIQLFGEPPNRSVVESAFSRIDCSAICKDMDCGVTGHSDEFLTINTMWAIRF